MNYAYLDASDNVKGISTVARNLAEAQAKDPLITQIVANAPAGLKVKAVNTDCYHQRTSGDGTNIDDYTLMDNLDLLKQQRRLEIDIRTQELIAGGYSYGGKTLSLSPNAQSYLIGMKAGLDLFTGADFPIVINTLDDLDAYSIPDATDAATVYGTAMATVKAHLGSGTTLKESIRDAADKTALDAIVDTR